MAGERLVIGTRGSQLALWQSNHVKQLLEALHPRLEIELVVVKTLGDKILDSPLSKIGDKGLFTKEIEQALLKRNIDLAVHSYKDLPTQLPTGLTVGAVLEREDVRDAFIAHPKRPTHFAQLRQNSVIATGSLRRRCQLLSARPDLRIVDIRGNLNTRLSKLEASEWDGMILAKAGVVRLGLERVISDVLPFEIMLPAVGQGALAVEMREDDPRCAELVRPLHHPNTAMSISGERALLRYLEGGCQIPIGTHGRIEGGEFRLDAVIGSLDGRHVVRESIHGPVKDAEKLGEELAVRLIDKGGKSILDEIRSQGPSAAVPAV